MLFSIWTVLGTNESNKEINEWLNMDDDGYNQPKSIQEQAGWRIYQKGCGDFGNIFVL